MVLVDGIVEVNAEASLLDDRGYAVDSEELEYSDLHIFCIV